MPFYCYICQEHDTTAEVYCTMSKMPRRGKGEYPICLECDKEMTRDFGRERAGQGNKQYAKPFVSDSLAMNPDQIPEHNRLFPGIKVLSDGRPTFHDYKQHDDYLKKTGFHKEPQKIKHRRKRVIK